MSKKNRFGMVDCKVDKLPMPGRMKLKPCPFCGVSPFDVTCMNMMTDKWYAVWCSNCSSTTGYYDAPEKAYQAWNGRA